MSRPNAEVGAFLLAQGRAAEAAPLLARALQTEPDDPATLHNFAAALWALGQPAQAEVIYRRLLGGERAGPNSWRDYGHLLLKLDRAAEALPALLQAHSGLPQDPEICGLLAQAALALGDWRSALPHLEAAIDLESDPAERTWNRAALDLLAGRWEAGWAGFEARWHIRDRRTPIPTFAEPAWDGAPYPGATLLLWCEQGMGDTLLALRYLRQVLALGGQVMLKVQAPLLPLVPPLPGLRIFAEEDALPPFDLQAPLMSLPVLLRDAPDAAPVLPYLAVPDRDAWGQSLALRLAALPPGSRVGLVWRGGDAFSKNHFRSLSEAALADIISTPNVQWIALQTGMSCPCPVALDLGQELTTFPRTAQTLAMLDRVVTVDTATANLAGALGLEAWVMLQLSADWRWMLGGERTPWYPSLRLFRQRLTGGWNEVIGAIQTALASVSEGRGTC